MVGYRFNSDEEAREFLDSKHYRIRDDGNILPKTISSNWPGFAVRTEEPIAILYGAKITTNYGNKRASANQEFARGRAKLEGYLDIAVDRGKIVKEENEL